MPLLCNADANCRYDKMNLWAFMSAFDMTESTDVFGVVMSNNCRIAFYERVYINNFLILKLSYAKNQYKSRTN